MRLTCLTTVHRITRLITQQRELILTQDLIGRLIDRFSFSWRRFDRSYKTVPLPLAAHEIAHRDGASKLVGYVLADYNLSPGEENESLTTPLAQPP
ncbi:hypothetical protein FIBSPDRAFT_872157 [Athelia psychrophila]|uniref:Uncharacterized protein n=1 Tax=Athelia psychrophila TaxID=1759441 RepID=A0A165ZQW1_9AGAM|nr:hypothetical protein FIBSPDRAFT_872157 [Fibularhizoctonia sp. CBS 109695]